MHTYLDSVGFRKINNARASDRLMRDVVLNFSHRSIFKTEDGRVHGEFSKQYAEDIGLTVCGEFDDAGSFHPEYQFPFYYGRTVSMKQFIDYDKHAATDSYGGICEDPRIGTSLIFYLTNGAKYETVLRQGWKNDRPTNVRLSALAKNGTVLLPIFKTPKEEEEGMKRREKYLKMVAGAREGNEEMIEALTEDDMNNYSIIQKRILKEDILSIVDTYFQPSGLECELYSICGNIVDCRKVVNSYTSESVWKMQIESCDMYFDLCINEQSLEGEPVPGARFRGRIWLQGVVEF